MSNLYCGDCLDVLKNIPDDSIDLIVTDPPYNIKKAKWDNIPHYIEWCGLWIKECERVLKSNGSFYFWHNDMIQIAQLMEWIRLNSLFVFNSFCVWDKGDFRAIAWKNPSDKNNLRSWFNTCEYCLSYNLCDGVRTAWDRTGLQKIKLDVNNFQTLRKYAYDLLNFAGGVQGSGATSWKQESRAFFLLSPEGVSLVRLAAQQTISQDTGRHSGNFVPPKHTIS
jgi:hypothetical protein